MSKARPAAAGLSTAPRIAVADVVGVDRLAQAGGRTRDGQDAGAAGEADHAGDVAVPEPVVDQRRPQHRPGHTLARRPGGQRRLGARELAGGGAVRRLVAVGLGEQARRPDGDDRARPREARQRRRQERQRQGRSRPRRPGGTCQPPPAAKSTRADSTPGGRGTSRRDTATVATPAAARRGRRNVAIRLPAPRTTTGPRKDGADGMSGCWSAVMRSSVARARCRAALIMRFCRGSCPARRHGVLSRPRSAKPPSTLDAPNRPPPIRAAPRVRRRGRRRHR